MEKIKSRLFYIDNLRLTMIILVVMVHLNVTYSGIGSWYYVENHAADFFSALAFVLFGSVSQSFFMGFLFFLAGYFVPSSCDKKGPLKFTLDRLFRLGIPTLFFMLILHPINMLIIWNIQGGMPPNLLFTLKRYIIQFRFIGESGPLWFAFALLIFTLFYVLIRLLSPKNLKAPLIRESYLLWTLFIIFMAGLTFAVRIVQPIGTNILNMQLCFFTQYILLFIAGIFARKNELPELISARFGKIWLGIGLIGGIVIWSVMLLFGGALDGDLSRFMGGLYWQSAVYALWESLSCVGICTGLITLYREKLNKKNRISGFLAANAFGVYVFHTPVVIFLTLIVRNWNIYPYLKFWIMVPLCLSASFAVSALIRSIPGLKKVFS